MKLEFLARIFRRLAKNFEEEKQEITFERLEILNPENFEERTTNRKSEKKVKKKGPTDTIGLLFDPRDMIEIMENPYLALSKNRKKPIYYERNTSNGVTKIKVSCHTEHYIASIYDWDIVLFVASRMQEIMNSRSDIPPRTMIIPRHELLKSLHKHDGKKQQKDLEASLTRLKTTLIETTVRNEDGRYATGFGWLDSWGYTDRKDIKEFRITLSQWLYDGICQKGSLLKVRDEYFDLTSGLKKFLYRLARKHVGTQNDSWSMSLETLYEKSAVERDLRKFKYDLKK